MSSINISGRLLDISAPKVMGIVNITPDSFFEGSRKLSDEDILLSVGTHIANGAHIIDIGGYSTRPMADYVSVEQEKERILGALEVIGNAYGNDLIISIDTFRSEVVESVLDVWGNSFIVNDVQAAEFDKRMLRVVGENGLPYIAMHSKGDPHTMDNSNQYGNVVNDIIAFFVRKLSEIREYSVDDVIFDVGFGFAKNVEQNFEIVRRFEEFKVLGVPQLVGVSRKRMICESLDVKSDDALNGTTVVNTLLLQKGAKILRVHDSKEAVQIIKLLDKTKWDF